MSEFLGPMWDTFKGVTKPVLDKYDRVKNLTGEADRIAEEQFPNSARDASTKNAFRHALGTGMLTRELGGGPIAAETAKRVGYLWEGLGLQQNIENPKYRNDTYHDLNANALGAKTAQDVGSQAQLIAALKNLALGAKEEAPPSFWQSSPGYMTRTYK